jgi:hypothetical protein
MRADSKMTGKRRDCAREDAFQLSPVNPVVQSGKRQPAMGVEWAEPRVTVAANRSQVWPLRNLTIKLRDQFVKRGEAGAPDGWRGLEIFDARFIGMQAPSHQVGHNAKHVGIHDHKMFHNHVGRPEATAVLQPQQPRHQHPPHADGFVERIHHLADAARLGIESPQGGVAGVNCARHRQNESREKQLHCGQTCAWRGQSRWFQTRAHGRTSPSKLTESARGIAALWRLRNFMTR